MLEVCFGFTVSVVDSLIPVSSMLADSDTLAFLLRVRNNTTPSKSIGEAKDIATEEAERYMASLITNDLSFSPSGTTPIVF